MTDQGPFAPVAPEEAKRIVADDLAKYFRLVASMLEVGAMKIDFYNAEATIDPARPNSQFGSLKGAYGNLDHGLTFNTWQEL
jgi:hypothetical protein